MIKGGFYLNSQGINIMVWKCSKCGRVDTDKHLIDKCCVEKRCVLCGKTLPKNWYSMMCTSCSDKKLFDSAWKMTWEQYVEKYPGNMIVLDDNFYSDIFEAMEYWEGNYCLDDE